MEAQQELIIWAESQNPGGDNVVITTKPKVEGVQGRLAALEKVYYWLSGDVHENIHYCCSGEGKRCPPSSPTWQLPWESRAVKESLGLGLNGIPEL